MVSVIKIAGLTGHNAAIFCLAAGKDRQHFLSGAGDGWVAEWNFDHPDPGRLLAKVDAQIFSLCMLTEQQRLVIGNMNGGIHWVDLENPANTRNIAYHKKGVYALCLTGEYVFSAGGDGKLAKWETSNSRSQESYHLTNQALRCIDFSGPRNELAIGASDHNIYLLDATSLELKHTIAGAHGNSVFSVRYSPTGQFLLSGGRDAHLHAWDLERGFKKISSQAAHLFTINDIVFQPDGRLFATASRDKTIKIWDAESFQLLKVLEGARDGGHFNSVNKLLWSDYNDCLVSCSDDRSIKLWKIDL